MHLSEARSRLYRSQILQVNTRWKALDEIYIFSFASLQISVIFQAFRTIFAKFEKKIVDFLYRWQVLQNFVKFSPIFFLISQNFSGFDRSDAKIAIFQRTVKNMLKFSCKFCENLSEKMYALNPSGGNRPSRSSLRTRRAWPRRRRFSWG